MNKKPNIVFVFADQWRQQATGYAGNTNVHTPNLDKLSKESMNFTHAISGCPVCTPYRASLLSGQTPLTHGVFVNDVPFSPNTQSIAKTFSRGGYKTAYIGKWHVDGHGRSVYIPKERQQGFAYWKVLECTHDYNNSPYYAGDSDKKLFWEGYDAIAQTKDAETYIKEHANKEPFMLMLSWGPPHAPYHTAPEKYKKMYNADDIKLRPNVPESAEKEAKENLAGYYAHCTALDDCIGEIQSTIKKCGIEENTVFVFTSDHGDMLGSHGYKKKQQPWDESIRVPFLFKYPGTENWQPKEMQTLIDAPDIMPTLLGLCEIPIPQSVEGLDFSEHIKGGEDPSDGAALLSCAHPFGQWNSINMGGREYRGIRTKQYTYVTDLNGPWLLFDNEKDYYQQNNLINKPSVASIQSKLHKTLVSKLKKNDDNFLPGMDYIKKFNYSVDETLTVPHQN